MKRMILSLNFHNKIELKLKNFIYRSTSPNTISCVPIMVTAAATAVGINMTFLLPYSMLRKGWGREHRGLATVDLSIGLFIPFFLATTCVLIASASQFHSKHEPGLLSQDKISLLAIQQKGNYRKL